MSSKVETEGDSSCFALERRAIEVERQQQHKPDPTEKKRSRSGEARLPTAPTYIKVKQLGAPPSREKRE